MCAGLNCAALVSLKSANEVHFGDVCAMCTHMTFFAFHYFVRLSLSEFGFVGTLGFSYVKWMHITKNGNFGNVPPFYKRFSYLDLYFILSEEVTVTDIGDPS